MTGFDMHQEMRQLRVLLVDDNAALRGALRVSLTAFGCARVLEADTVEKALAALGSQPIDLVITDWKMAPRDGIDLVRTLRRRENSPAPLVPVIMLSAYSNSDRIAQARHAGVDAFLVKPFTASALAAAIRETVLEPTHRGFAAYACTN